MENFHPVHDIKLAPVYAPSFSIPKTTLPLCLLFSPITSTMTFFLVLDVFLAAVSVYLVQKIISRPSVAPYPPGPKGLPFLGNALDMPTSEEWKTYAQWGNRWGNMFPLTPLLH